MTKVWVNETAKELKSVEIGDLSLKMFLHYDKFNIVAKTKIEQDPMDSDYMSTTSSSVGVLNEWIEDEKEALSKYDSLVEFYTNQLSNNKNKRVVIGNTYIEMWYNNVHYNITIGNTLVQQEQHTVYSSPSETDTVKKFIALSNAFRNNLG